MERDEGWTADRARRQGASLQIKRPRPKPHTAPCRPGLSPCSGHAHTPPAKRFLSIGSGRNISVSFDYLHAVVNYS
jgi:hypothetical protein